MRGQKIKRIIVLLLEGKHTFQSKYELAKKAQSSPAWVLMLTKQWEKQGLIQGLHVIKVGDLFEQFHRIRPKKQAIKSYSIQDAQKFLRELKNSPTREYALTTYAAENLLQKHLFPHEIELYVKESEFEEWHLELSKKGLYGGGNVSIRASTGEELFEKRQLNGWWIVNIPQLISDLIQKSGPAAEAGEMLLEKMVKTNEK